MMTVVRLFRCRCSQAAARDEVYDVLDMRLYKPGAQPRLRSLGGQGLDPNTGTLGWVLGAGEGRLSRCEGPGVSSPENL